MVGVNAIFQFKQYEEIVVFIEFEKAFIYEPKGLQFKLNLEMKFSSLDPKSNIEGAILRSKGGKKKFYS